MVAVGNAFTVSAFVAVAVPQPVTVYCTVTDPGDPPVTLPSLAMVADPVPFAIVHVPPDIASVNAGDIAPEHTVAAPPAIVPAFGEDTTIPLDAVDVPQDGVVTL
jgi:hypothetical protein